MGKVVLSKYSYNTNLVTTLIVYVRHLKSGNNFGKERRNYSPIKRGPTPEICANLDAKRLEVLVRYKPITFLHDLIIVVDLFNG